MKKRWLALLLAALLCVGFVPTASAAGETYSDVPADHWSAKDIYRATELGIFNGLGNGTFGRGQAITRAAFVTALVRVFGWESVITDGATFEDVPVGKWYYRAVETAVANNAIPVSGKNFRPDAPLTRGEMTAMLMRALGYTSLAGAVSGNPCPFSDVTANRGFITLAYDMGIVSGVGGGKFAPQEPAKREQAAAVLVRLHDKLYAEMTLLSTPGESVLVTVPSPEPVAGSELPTTPLEPIAQLYDALHKLKESGQDMSAVTLKLSNGGIRTIVSEAGGIVSSEVITGSQLDMITSLYPVRTYYSERYESAYLVYQPNFYQTVTIWYQSERSLAVKLQLARMFGVTTYVFG